MALSGEDNADCDPNTWTIPEIILVKHFDIKWQVDFDTQTIFGEVTLTCLRRQEFVKYLDLDIKDLLIEEITETESGNVLKYELGETVGEFGCKLRVHLPLEQLKDPKVRIKYAVSKTATALQWLTPEQTSGKKHPFLFSQCQAIHARSLLPCQDTPSVKATYSAEITVPEDLVVLMSALRNGEVNIGNGLKQYTFVQPKVIPSYLIAIAVGKLVSRRIGPRSLVWGEEAIIDLAEQEFSQTEEFIKIAESICGPYEWGIYDLLVLPPSFPYGGMENPCLTFVTPTILAGDKSLVDVIVHEISHSWMGNLVTNISFEHFWLNEGFTVFIERKIKGRIHGEKTRHFLSLCGLNDLTMWINEVGHQNPLTKLIVDLKGTNPDDSYSICPYEKGYTFLFYLENLIGGPAAFESFMKEYIHTFRELSVSTDDFKAFFMHYFQAKGDKLEQINWQKWLSSPGMPPEIPKYDMELHEAVESLAKKWIFWDPGSEEADFITEELGALLPKQVEAFLSILLKENYFPIVKLQKMNEVYKMDKQTNSEIVFRWLRLCVKHQWKEQVEPCFNFLNKLGRMKYVRPLYRELVNWEEVREDVIRNFKTVEKTMMHVTAYTVSKDLGITN